jgi:hypothetical protein
MFIGSKLAEDNGFLKAIKICSTASFRGKDNLAVPSREILRHVKDPYSMKHILADKIHGYFLPSFFPLHY